MPARGRPFERGTQRARDAARRGGLRTAASRRKIVGPWPDLDVPTLMNVAGLTDDSWRPWRALWRCTLALPQEPDDARFWTAHTGRPQTPATPASEVWIVAGRRGGKSRMAALVALTRALSFDAAARLAPGELAVVPVIAADKKQARVTFRYLRALCDLDPVRPYVHRILRDGIELRTGVNVEVMAASFRTLRGYTVISAVLDEVAFWRDEATSTNPDVEILDALRPGMATVPGALLVAISSPYARRGALWEMYERYYGTPDAHVVIVNADTQSLNPVVPDHVIARAYAEDPVAAASEYGSAGTIAFRSDVEAYVEPAAIQAVTVLDRRELPPVLGTPYVAFADPSGGAQDAFTLAIAHPEGDHAVLDAVRERRPPFSPDAVVEEYAALLHSYGLTDVTGDRYAGLWPVERFGVHGIRYTASEHSKSDLYRELLAPLNSGRLQLLDLPALRNQLAGLERRVSRAGKDSIDHAPGGHDDVANACAGALTLALPAAASGGRPLMWSLGKGATGGVGVDDTPPAKPAGFIEPNLERVYYPTYYDDPYDD